MVVVLGFAEREKESCRAGSDGRGRVVRDERD